MNVEIFSDIQTLGAAAASRAASIIKDAIAANGRARIGVATGNSQFAFIARLVTEPDIDWSRVEAFHLDEYVGMSAEHPASFRRWIRERFAERVHPASMHYLTGDAADIEAELQRYSALLSAAPIDVAFAGYGENGHIAFNDPPVADFDDPLVVKRVTLDEACRRQQVGEGHFPSMDAAPREALTWTCPTLFSAAHWVCVVPEARKAEAVRAALEGPVSTACPASLTQRHPRAFVYLDKDSASLLRKTT